MVTGRPYGQVAGYFFGRDLDDAGLTHQDAEQYLADTGFATALKFRFEPAQADINTPNRQRRFPWPPVPFAGAHIVCTGRHDVVWLHDGTVLDPMTEESRRIEDLNEVSYVLGVFEVVRELGDPKAVAFWGRQ
jgi:hypothetical protein